MSLLPATASYSMVAKNLGESVDSIAKEFAVTAGSTTMTMAERTQKLMELQQRLGGAEQAITAVNKVANSTKGLANG